GWFPGWPSRSSASFSGLCLAMFVLLVALILRPVGFGYRNKITDAGWRNAWDWALFLGGAVPALLFGVAFGNLFLGLPFHFDELERPVYTGGFFGLLRPFALLAGLVSLSMLLMHGSVYAAHGVLWVLPAMAFLAAAGTWTLLRARRAGAAFISSCLAVSATILTAGVALFPFLMASSTHPDQGLTIWDASSSARTLFIMLCAVVVILPLVLAYTAWVFRVLKGRITLEEIRRHTGIY